MQKTKCKFCGKFMEYMKYANVYVCCTKKCENKGSLIPKEQIIAERRKKSY